ELDPERSRAIGQARLASVVQAVAGGLHAGALARDPHLSAAIELLRLGMRGEASRELTAVDRSPARAAGESGQEALTLIAELYARAGDFRNAHALVRTDLRGLLRRPASAVAVAAGALAVPPAFLGGV